MSPNDPPARAAPAWISIVVPGFDSADTIEATLRSVIAQSDPGWEAIVVDDGSTDGTGAVAGSFAARDHRIRVLRQDHRGPAAARNAAMARARGEWLLFLDADDWIAPTWLARARGEIDRDPSLDAVHCGWASIAEDGTELGRETGLRGGDLFSEFAIRCAFPIHACIVRASVVRAAGGFDPARRMAEDWLLWQRIARRGAVFGRVAETLAFYRRSPRSLSADPIALCDAALGIIALGHSVDPAVGTGEGIRHPLGEPVGRRPAAELGFVSWVAGALIARGRDPIELVERIDPAPIRSELDRIADCITHAIPLTAGEPADRWPELWNGSHQPIARFLAAIEGRARIPGVAAATMSRIERLIATRAPARRPWTIGRTRAIAVETTGPIDEHLELEGVDRLHVDVLAGGDRLGEIELPIPDGRVSRWLLGDAIADRFAWPLLGRFFLRQRYDSIEFRLEDRRWSAWSGGDLLAADLPDDPVRRLDALHDAVGWRFLEQEIWSREAAAEPIDPGPDSVIVIETTEPIAWLRPGADAVLIETRLGGVPIGLCRVPAERCLDPTNLRWALQEASGFELCRAAVREAILWRPLGGDSFGDRLRAAAHDRRRAPATTPPDPALAPGSRIAIEAATAGDRSIRIIGRRPGAPAGTTADRRAALPRASAALVESIERRWGTPIAGDPSGGDRALLYVPELRSIEAGEPPPAARERSESAITAPPVETALLPILGWARLGPAPEVSLAALEDLLAKLEARGFRSVSLDEVRSAVARRRPIPGRAVLLTFETGARYFETEVAPLIRRFGFGAVLFPAGATVGAPDDEGCLRRLAANGIEVGAGGLARPLTTLPPEQIVAEVLTARGGAEAAVGAPVTALAYPFGDVDEVTSRLIGGCGFAYGFTRRAERATLADSLLALPRCFVSTDAELETFRSWVDGLGG